MVLNILKNPFVALIVTSFTINICFIQTSSASDYEIEDTKCIQSQLLKAGFSIGKIDGKLGPKSRKAAQILRDEFGHSKLPELNKNTLFKWCRSLTTEPLDKEIDLRGLNTYGTGKPIFGFTHRDPLQKKSSYSFSRTTELARLGEKSQRFELRHGDCGASKGWNDCNNDRQRTERIESPFNHMQQLGKTVWYGWSLYLPKDYPRLAPSFITLGQVKLHGWREPIWSLSSFKSRFRVNFATGNNCTISEFHELFGRWSDFVIVANYSRSDGDTPSFQLWVNGKLGCKLNTPIVTRKMISRSKRKLFFKYGIYNSYISRWLAQNATRKVKAKGFSDKHNKSGLVVKSAAKVPFRHNWGVKVPTQIAYYDEMRVGQYRSQVDIRLIEQTEFKPLD